MQLELPGLDTPLPALSDEAAVQVLEFLEIILARFQSGYADQIHRYYEQRSQHNLVAPALHSPSDDPPF